MEIIKFDTLGLDPKILRAITEMGFEEPSPIQAKAIPEVMAGHDVIGQAQTGTGKQQLLVFRFFRRSIRRTGNCRQSFCVRQENWQSR